MSNSLELERAHELLRDAETMLKEIERNRAMPPFAQTVNQYVALGHEISKFFREVADGSYRED